MTEKNSSEIILPAVVLAGAPATPEESARYSVAYRAEIPVAGGMMVQHVIDALNASSRVGDIYVVGEVQCKGATKTVPPAGSLIENLMVGVKACASENGHVLVATSDIPMITPEAIDDFICRCGDLDADFYYAIISKKASEERFPRMRRTYAKLAEGTFTGGNIMVVDRCFLLDNAGLIRQALDARKSVPRLARLIGFGILLRAIIAQVVWAKAIDLGLLEQTASRIMNAKVRAVQTPYPEIGADIDDTADIEFAERMFGIQDK